jgi:CheY-like chemotaxis protein
MTDLQEETARPGEHESAKIATPNPQGPRSTVLVVDDDEAVRGFERRVLTRAGFHVEEARNGLHAHHLVRNGLRPDLIVVDLRMPGLSGDVLARLVRQMCPEQKFLFVTGYVDRMMALPTDAKQDAVFLGKPFSATALAEAAAALVSPPAPHSAATSLHQVSR